MTNLLEITVVIIETLFIVLFGFCMLAPLWRMPKEKRFYSEKD